MERGKMINNPIVYERADPWVMRHTDGYYYFTGSVPGYQTIELRRGRTLNDLDKGEKKTVWEIPGTGILLNQVWAPEIHYIDGVWYIYFAASDELNGRTAEHHHRMFVIANPNADPFEGQWELKGQVKTAFDSFSLDATVFENDNRLYYVWAQQDPHIPGNSNLYISEMENPWTLKGPQILLSIPEYDWEKIGFMVNEGPAVIQRYGKIIITYSGSATDENYAMGLLWADSDADLLNGYSWHKLTEPVFVSSEENQQFGPGHNSFTFDDNGQDILVFHARPEKNKEGDPLSNPNRHAIAQPFTWGDDGLPIFGTPVANNKPV